MPGDDDPLVGETVGGRYRVTRLIERGGMGSVYEAERAPGGARVALKVLHPYLSDDAVTLERFRREAEATARLSHPNVVEVTDYQVEPDGPSFLVMELVEGRSLAEVMRADGVLAPERALPICVQLLDGLEAAHAAGIVHRDLKPTNVLLRSRPGVPDAVTVLDFGIAKLAAGPDDRRLTKQGAMVGTPAYVAPEQARGGPVDERADLYSVGVLLYRMLAGRLPYPHDDRAALLRALLRDEPDPLGAVRPDLDPALAAIVDRALAREPDHRWQTASEMRAALEAWPAREEAAPRAGEAGEAPVASRNGRSIAGITWVLVAAAVAAGAALGGAAMWLLGG